MNSFVSPATSLYLSSPFASYWAVSDNMTASSWPRDELSVQYDDRGRLQPFVETAEQRRARQAFLRKGKLSKRISIWLDVLPLGWDTGSHLDPWRSRTSVEIAMVHGGRASCSFPIPFDMLALRWDTGACLDPWSRNMTR